MTSTKKRRGWRPPESSNPAIITKTPLIITNTSSVEGRSIAEYLGIVLGEVVYGANIMRDFGAGITNLVGGRSDAYEEVLRAARKAAIIDIRIQAKKLEADAVVAVNIDYETIRAKRGNMLMVSVWGTAVKLEESRGRAGTASEQSD